jgi:hypothetical protein
VKNRCPSTTTNADLFLDVDVQQNPDGLLKYDEKCGKENDSASSNSTHLPYNSNLQKVRIHSVWKFFPAEFDRCRKEFESFLISKFSTLRNFERRPVSLGGNILMDTKIRARSQVLQIYRLVS